MERNILQQVFLKNKSTVNTWKKPIIIFSIGSLSWKSLYHNKRSFERIYHSLDLETGKRIHQIDFLMKQRKTVCLKGVRFLPIVRCPPSLSLLSAAIVTAIERRRPFGQSAKETFAFLQP